MVRVCGDASPGIGGGARRIHGDGYVVADFERFPLDALLTQLTGRAPFEGPALHNTLFIGRLDLQERMWIAEKKIDATSATIVCDVVLRTNDKYDNEWDIRRTSKSRGCRESGVVVSCQCVRTGMLIGPLSDLLRRSHIRIQYTTASPTTE